MLTRNYPLYTGASGATGRTGATGAELFIIDIELLRGMFGIPLIFLVDYYPQARTTTTKPDDYFYITRNICEIIEEDASKLIVRGIGQVKIKPHFNEIVGPGGSINPMFTVPEGYANCQYDILGINLDNSVEIVIMKSIPLMVLEVTDTSLISLYRSITGR
jgi:hypothetical protein